ncbi:MAG: hypothetical protein A2172_05235 [Candidatus Woykebacteria bacterium RBG_13_40_15]|uniref:HD domain-containing protein n=1 Tax=Candidatus Woykebacteria bacterium RBG_13_40_15 TaxID=1802593 RepID=A0A1G1W5V7_9BACT|nr:MAG: hypothetical protein A2172_05235 [Candidatus Woykebacteria bacterium RBG_13_40_15]
MDTDLYKKVKQFVVNSFVKADNAGEIKHFERTAYWIKQLNPNADEAMLIAAFSHDIERAFREADYQGKFRKTKKGFRDENHLRYHQQKAAEIITDFLKSQNANNKLVERVEMLVSKHEIGGNSDQNLLMDADSISFFENNIEAFLLNMVPKVGATKVKEKFDWMFDRISSKKAKEVARSWYENAIQSI